MSTKTNETSTPPQMVVEEAKTIPDGPHTGIIREVIFSERGDEGFPYCDLHIEETQSGVVIKAGYARSKVTPQTELGRLLARFGGEMKTGKPVPWEVLTGPVQFVTETENKGKKGKFARVILDTVAPKA